MLSWNSKYFVFEERGEGREERREEGREEGREEEREEGREASFEKVERGFVGFFSECWALAWIIDTCNSKRIYSILCSC